MQPKLRHATAPRGMHRALLSLLLAGVAGIATGVFPPAPAALSQDAPQLDASWNGLPSLPMPSPLRKQGKVNSHLAGVSVSYEVDSGRVTKERLPRGKRIPASDRTPGSQGESTGWGEEPRSLRPSAVFGTDDRQLITNTTVTPWSWNCALRMTFPSGRVFIASAAMISRKYVLTAGHCVFDHQNGGWARSIDVVPGRNGSSAPFGTARAVRMYSWEGWTRFASFDWDIALIELNVEVGRNTGYFGYGYFPTINGVTGNQAGYPGDRDGGTRQYYSYGPILRSTTEQVQYTMDTMGGQSGSGVYKREGEQRYLFAAHSYSNASTNGGCRISRTKYDWIGRVTAGTR